MSFANGIPLSLLELSEDHVNQVENCIKQATTEMSSLTFDVAGHFTKNPENNTIVVGPHILDGQHCVPHSLKMSHVCLLSQGANYAQKWINKEYLYLCQTILESVLEFAQKSLPLFSDDLFPEIIYDHFDLHDGNVLVDLENNEIQKITIIDFEWSGAMASPNYEDESVYGSVMSLTVLVLSFTDWPTLCKRQENLESFYKETASNISEILVKLSKND